MRGTGAISEHLAYGAISDHHSADSDDPNHASKESIHSGGVRLLEGSFIDHLH